MGRLGRKVALRGLLVAEYGETITVQIDANEVTRAVADGLAARVNGSPRARRSPLAAGSLEHRIVEVLKEARAPIQLQTVVNEVKARRSDVVAAMDVLRASRRVQRTGSSRWTRYALPEFAAVKES